jgi:hypothetical protein
VLNGKGVKNGDINTGGNKTEMNTGEGIKGVTGKRGGGINGLNTNGLKNAGKKTGCVKKTGCEKKNGLPKKKLKEKTKSSLFDT